MDCSQRVWGQWATRSKMRLGCAEMGQEHVWICLHSRASISITVTLLTSPHEYSLGMLLSTVTNKTRSQALEVFENEAGEGS